MLRRNVVLGGGAAMLLPPTVASAQQPLTTRPNGEWDGQLFHYRTVGADPFMAKGKERDLGVALEMFGLEGAEQKRVLDRVQVQIGRVTEPDEVTTMEEGQLFTAMVSGGVMSREPWVATHVAPHPGKARWPLMAWHFPGLGKFALSTICWNPIWVEVRGRTIKCRRDTGRGDLFRA